MNAGESDLSAWCVVFLLEAPATFGSSFRVGRVCGTLGSLSWHVVVDVLALGVGADLRAVTTLFPCLLTECWGA